MTLDFSKTSFADAVALLNGEHSETAKYIYEAGLRDGFNAACSMVQDKVCNDTNMREVASYTYERRFVDPPEVKRILGGKRR